MRLNPRACNQPLFTINGFRKLKTQELKKKIAVPPLFVEGEDGCGIKLEDKTKLVDNRAKKILGITDGADRIADVLHQHVGLMDRRVAHGINKKGMIFPEI